VVFSLCVCLPLPAVRRWRAGSTRSSGGRTFIYLPLYRTPDPTLLPFNYRTQRWDTPLLHITTTRVVVWAFTLPHPPVWFGRLNMWDALFTGVLLDV